MHHRLGSRKLLSLIIKRISGVMVVLFFMDNIIFVLFLSLTKLCRRGLCFGCAVFIAASLDLHPVWGWAIVNDVKRVAYHVSRDRSSLIVDSIVIMSTFRLGSIARHIVELVEDRRLCDDLSFRSIIIFTLNELIALMTIKMMAAAKLLEWLLKLLLLIKGLLLTVIRHLSVRLPCLSGLPHNCKYVVLRFTIPHITSHHLND